MKKFFQTVFSWTPFATSGEPKRLVLLGLDASGKTTFLYQIKNRADEVVTTIPTIGFNVETMKVRDLDFTCWDVGGCDKIRPLWRHYTQGIAALVFLVDSNDHERLESAKEELHTILSDIPSTVPLLVVNNKVDLPRSMNIDRVLHGLGLHEMRDRQWSIIPCCAYDKALSKDCLDWIYAVLAAPPAGSGKAPEDASLKRLGMSSTAFFLAQSLKKEVTVQSSSDPSSTTTTTKPTETPLAPEGKEIQQLQQQVESHNQRKFDTLWEDWILRAEKISPTEEKAEEDEFLRQFQEYSLPSWDHYTHVRLAYLLIQRYGQEKGFQQVEEGIRAYIQNNPSQTGGKSYHPTMTRFWCHMVAYWLVQSLTSSEEKKQEESEGKSQFWQYLVFVHDHKASNTDLAQGGLFRRYYSNEVIFGPVARASFIPPDFQDFPSYDVGFLERTV